MRQQCCQINSDKSFTMIRIEFDEPNLSHCDCCGNTTTRLTRFVYKDNDAFAVYYVLFTDGHQDKNAYSLIGLGEWGEDAKPEMRTAFAVNIWDNNHNWAVTITDRADSPWSHVEFLGRILDREEAITHPLINDVYHITDHIVTQDRSVIEYFR